MEADPPPRPTLCYPGAGFSPLGEGERTASIHWRTLIPLASASASGSRCLQPHLYRLAGGMRTSEYHRQAASHFLTGVSSFPPDLRWRTGMAMAGWPPVPRAPDLYGSGASKTSSFGAQYSADVLFGQCARWFL